jgi:hypothetical protein
MSFARQSPSAPNDLRSGAAFLGAAAHIAFRHFLQHSISAGVIAEFGRQASRARLRQRRKNRDSVAQLHHSIVPAKLASIAEDLKLATVES